MAEEVVVYYAGSLFEAHLLAGWLGEHGIRATVGNEALSSGYLGIEDVTMSERPTVGVHAEDERTAVGMIRQYLHRRK